MEVVVIGSLPLRGEVGGGRGSHLYPDRQSYVLLISLGGGGPQLLQKGIEGGVVSHGVIGESCEHLSLSVDDIGTGDGAGGKLVIERLVAGHVERHGERCRLPVGLYLTLRLAAWHVEQWHAVAVPLINLLQHSQLFLAVGTTGVEEVQDKDAAMECC